MEKLIDIPELAEMLQVAPGTVRSWIDSGQIPFVRLGQGKRGLIRFSQAQVQEYIGSHTIQPGQMPALPARVIGGTPGRRKGQRARLETVSKFAAFCKGESS